MADNHSFLDPELLKKAQALEFKAREVAEGVLLGIHHAPHRGRSIEFAEHKEYSPGDDLRRIDWKVFGKSDRLYIKEFEDDTNIKCLLLIDRSSSMTYQSEQARGPEGPVPAKLELARVLAGALSYLLLNQSDAVGLGIMGQGLQDFLPPRSRQAHFHEIAARLSALEPATGTDLARSFSDLVPLIKGRAMIVIFSDLFDEPEPLLKALKLLRHRRHEMAVFQVLDPDELEFPFERLSFFRDLEGPLRLLVDPRSIRSEYQRHVREFVSRVRLECQGHGIDYFLARSDDSPAKILTSWLSVRAAAQSSRSRAAR